MLDRKALIPVGENAGDAIERVLDAFGRSGVSLAECLDTDAVALAASDMRYFGQEYFGRVPTYANFMRYINQLPLDKRNEFKELVAEMESELSVKSMRRIASKTDGSTADGRIFKMYETLGRVAERRLDRIERARGRQADAAVAGADMAARIISALSNADLLKIKGQAEAIDAEYKEVALEGPNSNG